jgi:hypothetical protein
MRLTVSQSVSLGVESHLGLMTRYLLLFDSYGLVYVGRPLWREAESVFCIYAAGPRQRSLSRVRVPWDSWPYFTVSDLRLPFLLPSTTRRVTVEVFDPASTRVNSNSPGYNFSARITQKTSFFYCCVRILCRGNVFTEPLPRNICCLFPLSRGRCIANGCTRCNIKNPYSNAMHINIYE